MQLLQSETFWLAEKIDVPGKGWDANFDRIVTWAKFKDLKTKKIFYHFNTHFDDIGKIAMRESVKLLLQKIKTIAGNYPVIVTGDFNSKPTDEPIQIITNSDDPNHLTDTKQISETPHYGPTGAFNTFQSKEISDEPIDYIFAKNGVKV